MKRRKCAAASCTRWSMCNGNYREVAKPINSSKLLLVRMIMLKRWLKGVGKREMSTLLLTP